MQAILIHLLKATDKKTPKCDYDLRNKNGWSKDSITIQIKV